MTNEPRPLPETREELLALHDEWRARRKGADLGSDAYVEALAELGRIEIQIARIERAMDPPRG